MNTTKVTVWETKVTYINIETHEVTTIMESGSLTVPQAKELVPDGYMLVTKLSEKRSFNVDTEALILLEIKEENTHEHQ